VRSGFSSPLQWDAETTRQFVLARRGAAATARGYLEAGFVVVIDDVIRESEVHQYTDHLGNGRPLKVLLSPNLETVLARNALPGRKNFDASVLERSCRGLHPMLLAENTPARGWVVVDSTTLDVSETVAAIVGASRQG
jgi:hypothetical protein